MEPQEQQESSTEALVNAPTIVWAFGGEYEIKRFSIGQLIRAAQHLAPLGYLLESAGEGATIGQLVVNALKVGGDPALGVMSVAISKPPEWFNDKDPLEGARLLAAIIKKNFEYFFDSANLAELKAEFAEIREMIQNRGGGTSTPSSTTDTAH